MRLDKYLSANTSYSRSEIAQLIKQKRVAVNCAIAKKASFQITPSTDSVTLDDKLVSEQHDFYIMLHKPAGYVCANVDAERPTVIDLIAEKAMQKSEQLPLAKMQIAGRLDVDTTGLVLLTTNGDWNHRVTSPSRSCDKTYLVQTCEVIAKDTAILFSEGLLLKNEKKATKPAKLEILTDKTAQLTIREGKYHQVKRMFAAVGNKVEKLHRQSIGAITLDTALSLGDYKHLSATDISSISS